MKVRDRCRGKRRKMEGLGCEGGRGALACRPRRGSTREARYRTHQRATAPGHQNARRKGKLKGILSPTAWGILQASLQFRRMQTCRRFRQHANDCYCSSALENPAGGAPRWREVQPITPSRQGDAGRDEIHEVRTYVCSCLHFCWAMLECTRGRGD